MNAHPPVTADAAPHVYALRVYYEDTDAGGVVYHANYLRYAERARTEALRALGIPHAALVRTCGLMVLVRRVEVDYLAAARLDDVLQVRTRPLKVGGASLLLRQEVWRDDTCCAGLTVRLAVVAVADGRPGRLPPRWADPLRAAMVRPGD